MPLWTVLSLLSALAAAVVAIPLLRGRPPGASAQLLDKLLGDLADVDRKTGTGALGAEQAAADKAALKRRFLDGMGEHRTALFGVALSERAALAVLLSAIVVFGSAGLYGLTSAAPDPVLAQLPISAAPSWDTTSLPPVGASIGDGGVPQNRDGANANLASVDEMIDKLVQRLTTSPNDAGGWRMLGWSYFNTGKFSEAAAAYGEAVRLEPGVGAHKTARAEALAKANAGTITPEALTLLEDALKQDAKDTRARYVKGLAQEQAGDKAKAFDTWAELLKDAEPSEPWWEDLRARAVGIAGEIGADVASLPAAKQTMLETLQPSPTPPPASDRTGDATAAGDQQAMIRGMVDRLDARLKASPQDAEGWIKLIRSRVVLQEPEKAKEALKQALAAVGESEAERTRITSAAAALGIAP